ncbi:hypothetical protein SAMN06272739_2030 [Blastococcus haudaquaticus]|uniref:Uncharacterized protein n=1 Tax=Blastococcus haudaquaticus TaxID=1938745 RepID=A0A286GT95_9ACTN|nr:hypothetical protein SAMN06272739_2030 [Blastococcus haudaquaticus]
MASSSASAERPSGGHALNLDWLPAFTVWTPDDWSAFGTNVTAFIAVAAGLVAWRQLREARKLREEQAQPYVVCYAEKTPGHDQSVDIVIRNFGTTVARDVELTVQPSLMRSGHAGREPEQVHLPAQIPALVPGQEWRTWWDLGTARVDFPDLPDRHDVLVTYQDSKGKPLPSTPSVLDWRDFSTREWLVTKGVHEIATALQEIRRTVKSFQNSGRGGMAVFVRDGDAADQRQREARATAKAKHEELTRQLLPGQEYSRAPGQSSEAEAVDPKPDVPS